MKLNLPDDIVARAELSQYDARLALAIQLYADNRIDHADACRLADIPPAALNSALLRTGLSLQQYPVHSLIDRRTAG